MLEKKAETARALLCESIRALIFPSRMSCISSSSSADTVVLNASAIFRMSADKYGLKYYQSYKSEQSKNTVRKLGVQVKLWMPQIRQFSQH